MRIILGEVALDTTGWALLLPRHNDTWIVLDVLDDSVVGKD